MCLICGHIGCNGEPPFTGHNRSHYEETNHTYSMEIMTKAVYDFGKCGYV